MEREAEIGRANIQESAFPPTKDRFQNTITFIERALAEGAHFKFPEGTKQLKKKGKR